VSAMPQELFETFGSPRQWSVRTERPIHDHPRASKEAHRQPGGGNSQHRGPAMAKPCVPTSSLDQVKRIGDGRSVGDDGAAPLIT